MEACHLVGRIARRCDAGRFAAAKKAESAHGLVDNSESHHWSVALEISVCFLKELDDLGASHRLMEP